MGINTVLGARLRKESFSNKDGILIVKNMIKVIQENKQYLSDIDGQIGDGDHGINMSKGFTLCEEKLDIIPDVDLNEGLTTLSNILMTKIGGSMGPIYGFFFKSMAQKCDGIETIDKVVFKEMIEAVPANLSKISKAKPGDKTLLDCLIPAVDAYRMALEDNEGFAEALTRMYEAAEKGMESTKDIVAKVGRSSRLGERSKGVIDAGAASCCLIIGAIADSIKELLN